MLTPAAEHGTSGRPSLVRKEEFNTHPCSNFLARTAAVVGWNSYRSERTAINRATGDEDLQGTDLRAVRRGSLQRI